MTEERKSTLYRSDGTVSLKKLGAWIVGSAAVVAGIATLLSSIGGWVRAGLGVDDLERRVLVCEARLEEHHLALHPNPPPPNANERLNEVLPRIVAELEEGRQDRRALLTATTRLATIHEFGLTSARARTVASTASAAVTGVAARQERREEEPLDLQALLRSPEERRAFDMLLVEQPRP